MRNYWQIEMSFLVVHQIDSVRNICAQMGWDLARYELRLACFSKAVSASCVFLNFGGIFTMAKLPFPPFNAELLADIADQASRFLPNEKSREDVQKGIQVVVQNVLSKLDLVTREEFDAQTAVLQKTRAKLEELEKKLEQLSQ